MDGIKSETVQGKLLRFLLLAAAFCLLLVSRNAFAAASWGEAVTEWWYYAAKDGYHSVKVKVQVKNATYTGKEVEPTVKVTAADGRQLTRDVDYTVTYANNDTAAMDAASVTVVGIGTYVYAEQPDEYGETVNEPSNKVTAYFSILPKKVTGVKKAKATAPLANKLTWKKVKGVDGYKIYRSTKKDAAEYTEIAELPDASYTAYQDTEGLKNKKVYYYRVCAYVKGKERDATWDYIYDADVESEKFSTIKIKASSKTKDKYVPIYTGDADLDYAAEVICKKIIKKSMSSSEKVKAIYKWICKNCEHKQDVEPGKYKVVYSFKKHKKKAEAYEKSIMKKIYKGKAYLGDACGGAEYSLKYHKDSCRGISSLFKLLCNHVGITCEQWDGTYTNNSGRSMYHVFNWARTGGKYYWYDSDVGAIVSKQLGYVSYEYYRKTSKKWKKHYKWEDYGDLPKALQY